MTQHAFGQEARAVPKGEGNEDEARQRHELELDHGDEHLHGKDEEGEDDDHPGEQQYHDRQEIVEEAGEPHQISSDEHTAELQSLLRISYADIGVKKHTIQLSLSPQTR